MEVQACPFSRPLTIICSDSVRGLTWGTERFNRERKGQLLRSSEGGDERDNVEKLNKAEILEAPRE